MPNNVLLLITISLLAYSLTAQNTITLYSGKVVKCDTVIKTTTKTIYYKVLNKNKKIKTNRIYSINTSTLDTCFYAQDTTDKKSLSPEAYDYYIIGCVDARQGQRKILPAQLLGGATGTGSVFLGWFGMFLTVPIFTGLLESVPYELKEKDGLVSDTLFFKQNFKNINPDKAYTFYLLGFEKTSRRMRIVKTFFTGYGCYITGLIIMKYIILK